MAEPAVLLTPIFQKVNGVTRKVLPPTLASQVSMADGKTVEEKFAALQNQATGKTTTYVVEDITARNELTDLVVGDQAWVKNATGDPSVKSGGAKYIWEGGETGGWVKTSETESMDMSFEWNDIQNKPVSSPDSIDVAVNVVGTMDGHELTVSEETKDLLLDGKAVGGVYGAHVSLSPEDEGFADAVTALNLPNGAFFTAGPVVSE